MKDTRTNREKAEAALELVDLNWSNQATSIVGIGYAILALADAINEKDKS
jgi:hypothetical protein